MNLRATCLGLCLMLIGLGVPGPGAQSPVAEDADQRFPVEPGVYALFYTSHGRFACRLFEAEIYLNVKNFIELALGYKVWTDPRTGEQRRVPYYDGLPIYNVVRNAMVVGGDPLANGLGHPGYFLDDEFDPDITFDEPGRLAMANIRGRLNTNSGTWFVTLAPAPQFNRRYTIIGEVVMGMDVLREISRVEADVTGRPLGDVIVERIDIVRVLRTGEVVMYERSTHRPYSDIDLLHPLQRPSSTPTWAGEGERESLTESLPELPPIYGPLP